MSKFKDEKGNIIICEPEISVNCISLLQFASQFHIKDIVRNMIPYANERVTRLNILNSVEEVTSKVDNKRPNFKDLFPPPTLKLSGSDESCILTFDDLFEYVKNEKPLNFFLT